MMVGKVDDMDFTIDYWQIFKSAASMLWMLWPLWLLLLLLLGLRLAFYVLGIEIENWTLRRKFRKGESWRKDRESIQYLRDMTPTTFEHYVADLFTRLGYTAKQVGGPNDGGVDVVIEKDGIRSYIQCKKYNTSKVGVADVREFYGALADRLVVGKGYFVTTNTFTLEAERFAHGKPLELVDQNALLRYVQLAGGHDENIVKNTKE